MLLCQGFIDKHDTGLQAGISSEKVRERGQLLKGEELKSLEQVYIHSKFGDRAGIHKQEFQCPFPISLSMRCPCATF